MRVSDGGLDLDGVFVYLVHGIKSRGPGDRCVCVSTAKTMLFLWDNNTTSVILSKAFLL